MWEGVVPISIIGCEFKFVLLGPGDDDVQWESSPNRCWSRAQVEAAAGGSAVLTTAFADPELRLRLRPAARGGGRGTPAGSRKATMDEVELLGSMPVAYQAGDEPSLPSRYTFKPTVSCFEVPDLCDLDESAKKAIWWRPADFQDFLKARMEIARVYQQHLRDGMMDQLPQALLQRNESRRGLGLGRAKVRLNNTRAYIDAVLREQARQFSSGSSDDERLATVARAVSQADLAYSMANAESDAAVARAYVLEAPADSIEATNSAEMSPNVPALGRVKKVESFGLFQPVEDDDEDDQAPSMPANAAGFGLSQEELLQNGLRATGRRDASLQSEENASETTTASSLE